jgi:hypothetical protein
MRVLNYENKELLGHFEQFTDLYCANMNRYKIKKQGFDMKTNSFFPLIAFAGILALVGMACTSNINLGGPRVTSSGKTISETRTVSGFDQVTLSGAGDLYIEQGDKEALTIDADSNLMPYLTSVVKDGRLVLSIKPNINIAFSQTIVYHLTVKDIHDVQIEGSGKVQSDAIKTTDLQLGTSGSGSFLIKDLQATTLKASTGGSGKFELTGKATDIRIDINGSGKFDCPDLESTTSQVTINGSGNSNVWAKDSLTVNINGSG